MIRIDEDNLTTLHLTRGDRCTFRAYVIDSRTRERYYFPAGCWVSFVIIDKLGYTLENPLLRKKVFVPEDTDEVEFTLTSEDTKIGDMIDKKQKYWYNIVVNDDVTILGSDEQGEKVIIIYPEVGEKDEQ